MRTSKYDKQAEVVAWQASGQGLAQFAKTRGYGKSTLERWWREERARAASAPKFARVHVTASAPALVIEIGSARVRVSAGFDVEVLRQVVAALEAPR